MVAVTPDVGTPIFDALVREMLADQRITSIPLTTRHKEITPVRIDSVNGVRP